MRTRSKFVYPALVMVTVAAVVLGSCTTTPASLTAEPTSQSAAGSKPTGTLTIALEASVIRFGDPMLEGYIDVGSPVWESLTLLDSQGNAQPMIAERWEVSDGGKTQTFYIRKGIKFTNGDDLTGADVKFSLERFIGPDARHSQSAVMRAAVQSVELKDDYTVVLHLKQPSSEILPSIFAFTGAGAVVPKKYIEQNGGEYFNKNPIGSGPWKVVKFQPGGTEIEFEAVEGHWRATPKFKTVKMIAVPEAPVRVNLLKTGAVDIAGNVDYDSVKDLKAAGLSVFGWDMGKQDTMMLHFDDNIIKTPFDDVRVRKALSLAINRQEIADKLYSGYAKVGMVTRLREGYYDPALKPTPYDPKQAKELLAQAGYADGFTTKMLVATTTNPMLAQAIDAYWRAIGVKNQILTLDGTVIIQMHLPKFSPEQLLGNTWLAPFTGVIGWNPTALYRSGQLHKFKSTPRLDELIDAIPGETDPAKRAKMQYEAADIMRNEYYVLELTDPQTLVAYGRNVGKWETPAGQPAWGLVLDKIPHAK